MNAIGAAKSVKLGLASVPESTSSWFKTVMDPAHAREYGCNGVPDEAHCPSLILQDRVTQVLTPNSFARWYTNSTTPVDGTAVKIQDVWIIQSQVASDHFIAWARGTFTPSSGGNAQSGYSLAYITNTGPSASAQLARCVAFSATVEYVGIELNRGGYFEACHVPQGAQSGDASVLGVRYNVPEFTNYVSYTARAEQGVYIVCRMNDMDVATMWGPPRTIKFAVNVNDSIILAGDKTTYWPNPGSGWMANAVHYVTTNVEDWVLRVTANRTWEVAKSPAEGGRDGVVMDESALKAYLHITDVFDPIYPASFNDLQKVLGKVSTFMKENDKLIGGLAGLVPYGNTIHQVVKSLAGLGAPPQTPQAVQQVKKKKKKGTAANAQASNRARKRSQT